MSRSLFHFLCAFFLVFALVHAGKIPSVTTVSDHPVQCGTIGDESLFPENSDYRPHGLTTYLDADNATTLVVLSESGSLDYLDPINDVHQRTLVLSDMSWNITESEFPSDVIYTSIASQGDSYLFIGYEASSGPTTFATLVRLDVAAQTFDQMYTLEEGEVSESGSVQSSSHFEFGDRSFLILSCDVDGFVRFYEFINDTSALILRKSVYLNDTLAGMDKLVGVALSGNSFFALGTNGVDKAIFGAFIFDPETLTLSEVKEEIQTTALPEIVNLLEDEDYPTLDLSGLAVVPVPGFPVVKVYVSMSQRNIIGWYPFLTESGTFSMDYKDCHYPPITAKIWFGVSIIISIIVAVACLVAFLILVFIDGGRTIYLRCRQCQIAKQQGNPEDGIQPGEYVDEYDVDD